MLKYQVNLSIIGHQPCGNFAVQHWIEEEVAKLPENHELVKAHLNIIVNPSKHDITLQLYLESQNKDGSEEFKKRVKSWTIDYSEAEKFYRMMEKMS